MNFKTAGEIFNRSEIAYEDGTSALRVSGNFSIGGYRDKVRAFQDLSVAPFEVSTSLTNDFYWRGINVHITDGSGNDVPIMETLTIKWDESDNNYDGKPIVRSFVDDDGNATSFYSFFPDSTMLVPASTGTQLTVSITNANLTGVAYVTLYLEVM